jgi:hypothetical protein
MDPPGDYLARYPAMCHAWNFFQRQYDFIYSTLGTKLFFRRGLPQISRRLDRARRMPTVHFILNQGFYFSFNSTR